MKLVKHGDELVAVVEHAWEKAFLTAQRGKTAWVPLFPLGLAFPIAEIDPVTRQVILCAGQDIVNQQEVVFHDN